MTTNPRGAAAPCSLTTLAALVGLDPETTPTPVHDRLRAAVLDAAPFIASRGVTFGSARDGDSTQRPISTYAEVSTARDWSDNSESRDVVSQVRVTVHGTYTVGDESDSGASAVVTFHVAADARVYAYVRAQRYRRGSFVAFGDAGRDAVAAQVRVVVEGVLSDRAALRALAAEVEQLERDREVARCLGEAERALSSARRVIERQGSATPMSGE